LAFVSLCADAARREHRVRSGAEDGDEIEDADEHIAPMPAFVECDTATQAVAPFAEKVIAVGCESAAGFGSRP